MDRVKREAYDNDSCSREDYVMPFKKVRAHHHGTNQHKTLQALNAVSRPSSQESEPWRGSSGFGLASILNRTSSSSTMPKLNLPSFPRFSKPSVLKPGMALASTHHEDKSHYVSNRYQPQHRSADSLPAQRSPLTSSPCRIASAPLDDEEPEKGADITAAGVRDGNVNHSIRGGRWSADEHERFLEGFRIHGHKWKRVQQVVQTRSVTQVRTHAQKYLLKVAKLKAEKKQSGKSADMATLASETHKRSMKGEAVDGPNTAYSTPELGAAHGSPRKTPIKKVRRLDPGKCDPVDEQYIAAAATTLCFLMSQKIDSLFDSRHELQMDEHKPDYEPYDCYAPQTAETEACGTRKRSYMHFITDEQEDYSNSYESTYDEPSSYPAEGSRLCS